MMMPHFFWDILVYRVYAHVKDHSGGGKIINDNGFMLSGGFLRG